TNALVKYSQSKGDGQSYPCPSIASAHLDARLDPAFPVPVVEPLVEDVLDQVLDLGWRPSPLRRPILLGEFTACAVLTSVAIRLCCKSRFALMSENSAGRGRGFRVKM